VDNALDFIDFAVVDIHLTQTAHAGHELHQAGHPAHFANGLHLFEKIIKAEGAFGHLSLHLLGFGGVELLLGFFHQRNDIAHAENPAGHAVGVKFLELFHLFADADEFDRLAGNGFDR